MPIYEYKCTECDHRLEKLQKMNDDPLKDCPECSQSALVKLVSASRFKLKGTGWYETDFKGGSSNKAETSAKDGEKAATGKAATEKTSSTSTDSAKSKSAAKPSSPKTAAN